MADQVREDARDLEEVPPLNVKCMTDWGSDRIPIAMDFGADHVDLPDFIKESEVGAEFFKAVNEDPYCKSQWNAIKERRQKQADARAEGYRLFCEKRAELEALQREKKKLMAKIKWAVFRMNKFQGQSLMGRTLYIGVKEWKKIAERALVLRLIVVHKLIKKYAASGWTKSVQKPKFRSENGTHGKPDNAKAFLDKVQIPGFKWEDAASKSWDPGRTGCKGVPEGVRSPGNGEAGGAQSADPPDGGDDSGRGSAFGVRSDSTVGWVDEQDPLTDHRPKQQRDSVGMVKGDGPKWPSNV